MSEAALAGEGDALIGTRGDRVTYEALRRSVETATRALHDVGPGSLVAVAEASPFASLVAILAAWARGAAVFPLDPRAPPAASARLVARARPHAVVRRATLEGEIDLERPDAAPRAESDLADTALLLFTSGSTAEPKGVVLGAEGLSANVAAILAYLPIREAQVAALASPLGYSYGLVGQALTTLTAGATLADLAPSPFATEQLASFVRLGVRGLSSVPTTLRALARAAIETGAQCKDARFVASAGAALDAASAELLSRAFPGAELFNQYGLTEASPRVTALSSRDPAFARGSVGHALEGMEVEVRRDDGSVAGPNDEGRLFVRGPSVMLGYLDDPEATRAVLGDDGWLETGDIARVDDAGYLFVGGRRDGVVKCGGERVSVEEVAAALRRAEGVRDACVIAEAHAETGARLYAFVEAASDALPRLRAFARAELAPAKRPAEIFVVDPLPRGATGKIALHELHARIPARGAHGEKT